MGRIWLDPVIQLAHTNDGISRGQQSAGVFSDLRAVVGQVTHTTRLAVGNPLEEVLRVRRRLRGGNSGEFEPALTSQLLDCLPVHTSMVTAELTSITEALRYACHRSGVEQAINETTSAPAKFGAVWNRGVDAQFIRSDWRLAHR